MLIWRHIRFGDKNKLQNWISYLFDVDLCVLDLHPCPDPASTTAHVIVSLDGRVPAHGDLNRVLPACVENASLLMMQSPEIVQQLKTRKLQYLF